MMAEGVGDEDIVSFREKVLERQKKSFDGASFKIKALAVILDRLSEADIDFLIKQPQLQNVAIGFHDLKKGFICYERWTGKNLFYES